jgi:hypothetical protein
MLLAAIVWIGLHRVWEGYTAANSTPWSAFLRRDHALKIVFSDPNIASLQQAFGYRLTLADYNVAAVDATTALRIGGIVPPSHIQTFLARAFRAGDFKTDDNFIVMGSPLSNPWVGLFQEHLDFEFQWDPERKEEVIRNKRPASGEAVIYAPTIPGWGTGQACPARMRRRPRRRAGSSRIRPWWRRL